MAHTAQIVATAIRDSCEVIRSLGGDLDGLCRKASVALSPRPDARFSMPLATFVALNQVASRDLGAPHFGRLVGSRFDLSNIGDVGRAVLSAPTLGTALRVFERAFAAAQSETEFRVAVSGNEATVSYRILDEEIWPRDQDAELTICVVAAMIAKVAGPGWRPLSTAFEHAPNGADARRETEPGCPVSYGARANSVTFETGLLDRAMPSRDAAHHAAMAAAVADMALTLERSERLSTRVRRQVARGIGRAAIGQSEVAKALGMSRRTLRRRLDEEGAHFSEIVAGYRVSLGCRLLRDSHLSLAEIADRLGYSEVSAFERAFHRHAQTTPAKYRKAAGPGGRG